MIYVLCHCSIFLFLIRNFHFHFYLKKNSKILLFKTEQCKLWWILFSTVVSKINFASSQFHFDFSLKFFVWLSNIKYLFPFSFSQYNHWCTWYFFVYQPYVLFFNFFVNFSLNSWMSQNHNFNVLYLIIWICD